MGLYPKNRWPNEPPASNKCNCAAKNKSNYRPSEHAYVCNAYQTWLWKEQLKIVSRWSADELCLMTQEFEKGEDDDLGT